MPPPASHICQGQGALVSVEGRRQGRPRRSRDWREVGNREASPESQAQPQVREGPKRGSGGDSVWLWGHSLNSCRWVEGQKQSRRAPTSIKYHGQQGVRPSLGRHATLRPQPLCGWYSRQYPALSSCTSCRTISGGGPEAHTGLRKPSPLRKGRKSSSCCA